MAKKFLTHIDLSGNQLIKASFEKLSTDPVSNLFQGRMYYNTTSDAIKIYDGATWVGIGEIVSISGTTNEVEVSVVDGVATIGLPSNIHVDVTGDLTGNADTATNAYYATTAGTANSVDANSVNLGTDTVGDYVSDISGNDGVSVSGSGEGASVTISNTDKGSDQSIFKTINADTGYVSAVTNNDSLTISGGNGVTTSVSGNTISVDNDGILDISGTANQIDVSTTSGSSTVSLPNSVIFPGTVTLNADPQNDLEAATKHYVDSVATGLSWHQSVNLLYNDSTPTLSGATGTLLIDGHSALTNSNIGYRILINQGGSDSGIYVYNDDGTTWTLTRAADANTDEELIGASVFVMEGDIYGTTAWIQTNHYISSFADQDWVQFSGSGTYDAGNGIQLIGTQFSIDTDVTVDVNSVQTLDNKTLLNPTVSGLYLSDNNIVIEGTADTHETTLTFTDPTADRTITFKDESGTVAFTADITSAIDALTTSDIEEGTNLYFTDERAQDAVGDNISGSNSLSATYDDGAGTFSFDTTLATTSYMSKTSGLAVDVSALETKLTTDGFTSKASGSVGNGANTSFAISHNLGTRDVVVNVYDNSTYDTVECDVVRTDVDTVTVSFAIAPSSNAYRVVVVG